ncbi:uncharacterized protein AruCF_3496 [Achromobacter ruhlandii]|nr:uncharacterized protein AruCF_3496 [Achromobacter ruhlandii]
MRRRPPACPHGQPEVNGRWGSAGSGPTLRRRARSGGRNPPWRAPPWATVIGRGAVAAPPSPWSRPDVA